MALADGFAADTMIDAFCAREGVPVRRSSEDVACVLLALARDLLQDTRPAISHMIRYALVEFDEERR